MGGSALARDERHEQNHIARKRAPTWAAQRTEAGSHMGYASRAARADRVYGVPVSAL